MRRIWLLLLVVLVVTCVTAEEITVAAAADLNYALNDLAHRFETTTGNKVKLSFGASGNLYSQIQSGAPFDLFFSADEDYPKKLANAGTADALVAANLCCRSPCAVGAQQFALRSAEAEDGFAHPIQGDANRYRQSSTCSLRTGRDVGASSTTD